MSRRLILLFVAIVLLSVMVWQLPTLLKVIPSRYVAAYFPEPVQALAAREHVEMLPTANVVVDSAALLESKPAIIEVNLAEANSTPTSISEVAVDESAVITSNNKSTQDETQPESTPSPSATPTVTPVPIPVNSRLGGIRHHFQTWNNCGPATLAMALSYFDLFLSQEKTAASLKPNPEDRNVSPNELVAFVNQETDLVALDRANGDLRTLKQLVANGFPVIVELGLDPPGEYRWMGWYGHYLFVVAYDDASESVSVYDSWFGTSEQPGTNADDQGRQISYSDLDRYWRQFNRNYIVLFQDGQESELAQILGPAIDDAAMWQDSFTKVMDELAEEPEDAYLWFNLGTIYNALGDYEKAATAFDQARAIGLPWRMLWYQFGPYEAYYQVGRYDDVVLLAETTLKDRPYFEESYYYKGLAEAALGQTRQARADLEKAVRFNPLFTPAIEELAQLDS
jgi:tetratricopeptide (TPR) repeat protein